MQDAFLSRLQPRHWRASEVGYVLAAVLVGVALIRSRGAPVHRPKLMAHAVLRDFYNTVTDGEPEDRAAAVKKFRASHWSQEDRFFDEQKERVHKYAKAHDVAITVLLDTLDVGMHEHWPTPLQTTPVATVIPCRPRLVY